MVRTPDIRIIRGVLLGLAVFAATALPLSTAFAQTTPAPATAPAPGATTPPATPTTKDIAETLCATNVVCAGVTAVASVGQKAVSAGQTIGQCIGTGLIDCAITGIGTAMLGISTFFLGIAGTLFNLVVVKTVFQFSQFIGNAPQLLLVWGILRDLGNMALLFGFIFMGLATILDLHTYNAKKALPPLIIFAVLMNFSLFAAEGVIDTSNLFSSILYAQANTAPCGFSGTVDASGTVGGSAALDAAKKDDASCAINYGIGGSIMQATGLSTMFKVQDGLGTQDIVVYLGLSLFAIIGAIVMFAASIMLIIRAVTLTFLMVFSPIGFAGMAIPPLRSLATRWWSQLIHQSFYAPLLLLLIFISLKVTEGFGNVGGAGLAGAMLAPGTSTMGVILVFVIVIGFLIGSLKAANSFGAIGASFAINMGKNIVRAPLGAASGFIGRNSIGRGAAALQKKYEPIAGRSKLLSSNFLGLDSGIAGVFGAAKGARFGGGTSYKEREDHHKSRHEELEKAERKAEAQKALDTALAMPEGDARNDKIAEVLQRMSVKEIEELKAMKHADASLDAIAQNLSPEKFAALMKEGSGLNETQKSDARAARFKKLAEQRDILANPDATEEEKTAAKKIIRQYSAKDLENAPPELLSDDQIVDTFSDTQRDDLIKSNNVNPAITRKLRGADPAERVKAAFAAAEERAPGSGADAIQEAVRKLKPKKIAKLSDDILRSRQIVDVLRPEDLQALDKDGELDPNVRDDISAHLRNRIALDSTSTLAKWLTTTPAGRTWI
ncbi:hypothetical protein BH11PAT2_BH11PAT2_08560 [soil metagenome]